MTGRPEKNPIKVGDRFGLLTATQLGEPVYQSGYPIKRWDCKCDCGALVTIRMSALKSGNTKSCGCQSSRATMALRSTIHGHAANGKITPEFRAWCKMIARCYDENDGSYDDYGGRGIGVCKRWQESFLLFFKDMGLRPSSVHSIDRKNNNGNYELSNCRWATPKQQSRNRRNNRLLEYKGVVRCVGEWEEVLGLNSGVLRSRLHLGWEGERLFQPQIFTKTKRVAA